MKVKDVLKAKQREIITAQPQTTVGEAMELLISNKIGCLPVVDDKDGLVGILSDKDIFLKAHSDPKGFRDCLVRDLMTVDVVIGLPDDSLSYIAGIMTNNRFRHVPILDNQQLAGLISIGDVVKTQMESIAGENRYLRKYITGEYPA
ncbi:MAG: CBS domain-containing protein [candidate division Zixibacteria bacterium]|nr:CBS domain-containing protein [candidate division Zixibacteria bacterium]